MLHPITGLPLGDNRVDPRQFWMVRPDVAGLAQRTKAARTAAVQTQAAPGTAAGPVGAPSLPPLAERVAVMHSATDHARANGLTTGAYRLVHHVVADWDGQEFRNPRAA